MSSQMYGRPVRADVIREVWSKIKFCAATNTPSTIENLVNQLQKSLGWNNDECELKLKQCLDCGVLSKKVDPITRHECYFIPEDAPDVSECSLKIGYTGFSSTAAEYKLVDLIFSRSQNTIGIVSFVIWKEPCRPAKAAFAFITRLA